MFYTKSGLFRKLQKHYKTVQKISESNTMLIVKVDDCKIEIKKMAVAAVGGKMPIMYQY